jgi:hypothetical protein
VFCYEFRDRDKGKSIARQAVKDAETESKTLEEKDDSFVILRLLHANLDMWAKKELEEH